MSRFLTACIAALFAWTVLGAPVRAATTGLVRGTVTVDGKPASGARVTLEGEGSRFQATTDAKGDYVFPQVPFGSYRVAARANGAHELQVLVTVSSDAVVTVNVALSTQLIQIAQTTVTAHAGGLQANAPSVNQLTRATIQTSPVQNSLDKLIGTLPGVIPFSYNEPVINGFHGVTYNIDGAPLAPGNDLEFRRNRRSEEHRLVGAADRRDSGRVRRRPDGRRREHHHEPADRSARRGLRRADRRFRQPVASRRAASRPRLASDPASCSLTPTVKAAFAVWTRRRSTRFTTTRRKAISSCDSSPS